MQTKEIQPTDKLTLTEKGQEVWESCCPQYRYIINKVINSGLEHSDMLPTYINQPDYTMLMIVCDDHMHLESQERVQQQIMNIIQENRDKKRRAISAPKK